MKKILIYFALIFSLITYSQESSTLYFYFRATIVSSDSHIPNFATTKGLFKSQIFACEVPGKQSKEFLNRIQNEADSNFKNFLADYVKNNYPEWLNDSGFYLTNHTFVERRSRLALSQSLNHLSEKTIYVNYLYFNGCPRYENLNSVNQNTTQSIGNISSISRNSSNNDGIMYASNGLPTTPEIEAIKARSQAEYERKVEKIQAITNLAVDVFNYFEQRRQQRQQAYERQLQREQQERERKQIFNRQANEYRKEYKAVVNARKELVNQPKLISTLDEDGTGFKPLYIYFAYVPNDYDYYSENIKYPSTLDFKINPEVDIKFSPVFAFFPYSNGQYPFIEDVKSQIINEYFGSKANYNKIFFFKWERNVEDVVNSLKNNMNKAVNKHYFNNAIPSSNSQIIFLNSKINASQSKDYWTGEKVKKKSNQKIDYFNNDKPKSKSKKDYWDTSKKKKTIKDTTTTKKKKVNYWDN